MGAFHLRGGEREFIVTQRAFLNQIWAFNEKYLTLRLPSCLICVVLIYSIMDIEPGDKESVYFGLSCRGCEKLQICCFSAVYSRVGL